MIAVYYLFRLSSLLPYLFWQYFSPDKQADLYTWLTMSVIQLFLIVFFLFGSDLVASLLIREDTSLNISNDVTQGVLVAVFLLIGLILLFQGLPEVVVDSSRSIYHGSSFLDTRWYQSLLKVLFGIGLVLSARKGSRFILRDSKAGYSVLPEDFPARKYVPFIVLAGAVVLFLTLYFVF